MGLNTVVESTVLTFLLSNADKVTNQLKGERRYSCAKKDKKHTAAKCLEITCQLGPNLKEKFEKIIY